MEEALLVHLVENAPLTRPRANGREVFLAFLPRADIAHLNDN